jgi:thioester reductase-like protein
MTEPAAAEGLYDIAVVGMAGRFPGAPDTAALWQNLCRGVESISFFDEGELLRAGVPRETIAAPGFVAARGVVTSADLFDAPLFGFSPREARLMDPQQRLFLECAWVALGDASCDPGRCPGLVGVYAGVSQSSYFLANVLADPDLLRSVSPLEIRLANDRDFLATLTSYRLNLRGPSVTVATACSSSLVAVHLACQALLNRETDVALAGGAALSFPQVQGYLHEPGGILSADGHCRAFDAAASGSVGGDGVGLVVLKRLADALADRDSIRAVIKGSAIANDGAGKIGFTAPSVEGQAATIAQAQSAAGIAADSVTYVEAHGSGTPLGDPVEIRALTRAFRAGAADPERRGYCAVGSVKTNLGHLDAAAGIAGLIKTVLALEHRVIPPSLHFRQPNPAIPFAETPFFVAAEARRWEDGDGPRRAGVNSFGIGGTNAHVVLEEAPAPLASGPSRPWQLLLLSAAGEGALERATGGLAAHLAAHPEASLADVAHSGRIGRPALRCRRALVCGDREEAMAGLAGVAGAAANPEIGGSDASRLLSGSDAVAGRPVAFLLPGVGDHYPGMASGLYETEEVFRREVDRAAELLVPLLGADVRTALFAGARSPATGTAAGIAGSPAAGNAVDMARHPAAGRAVDMVLPPAVGTAVDMARYTAMATAGDVVPPPAGHGGLDLRRMVRPRAGGPESAAGAAEPAGGARAAGRGGGADGLDDTLLAQPAVFVVDYALARLWESWGVRPRALLGYSLGEYVAACLAGVLSLADAVRVVAWRARQIGELPPGAMLAVALPEAELAAEAGLHGDVGDVDAGGTVGAGGNRGGLSLAAVNGPEQTVVSGTPEAIAALAGRLGERGVACRRLPATHAFHSSMLQPLAAPFARFLAGIELRSPRIPYVTNVTGTWVTERQATDPEHWARHMVQPVRFAAGLAALWQEEPATCLLEVGPGHGLTTLARQQGPESGESGGPGGLGGPGDPGGPGRVVLPSLRPLYDPRPDGAFLLDTVAKLWLAGVEIDWAAFAAGERRNRVPLPAYPFERRRHWIEPRVSLAALLGVGEVVAVAGPAGSPAAASTAGPAGPPAVASAGAGATASSGIGDAASAGAGATASAGTGDSAFAGTGDAAFAGTGATASAGTGDAASAGTGDSAFAGAGDAASAGTDVAASAGAGDVASAGTGDAASAPISPAGAAEAHPRPPLRTPFVAPRSPHEERVAAIFQELLRIDAVGVHDSFFELGGTSLLAPQVLLRLRLACDIDLPLPRLLAQPTVALVARAVEELAAAPVDAAPGATAAAGAISAPAAATAATAAAAATAATTATVATSAATAAPPDLAAEVVLDPAIQGAAEGPVPAVGLADPEAVLLTGATGFLGAFLLRDLLEQTRARVVCLVRAANAEEALARILANLERHRLALPAGAAARIVPLPGDLEAWRWNLSEAAFAAFAAEVEAIYHAAAWVNFTYPYAVLKPANVTGTEEALRLAATGRRKPLHFISTIAVFPPAALADGVGREDADLSSPAGLAGGYPESKWVAERLVELGWRRGVPVTIHRPGLIGGDSRTGIGNPRDLLWAFLKSCLQLGAAPELASHFDPAPVDFVSRSIVHLSRQPRSLGRAFHHVHPRPLAWRELFDAAESLGYPVRRLSLEEWTPLLAAALDRSSDNALAPFRSLFFGPAAAGGGDTDTDSRAAALAVIPRFAAGNTLAGLAGSPIEAPPLDRRLLEIYFAHLIASSFLPPPPAPAPPLLAPPERGGGAGQGAAARP